MNQQESCVEELENTLLVWKKWLCSHVKFLKVRKIQKNCLRIFLCSPIARGNPGKSCLWSEKSGIIIRSISSLVDFCLLKSDHEFYPGCRNCIKCVPLKTISQFIFRITLTWKDWFFCHSLGPLVDADYQKFAWKLIQMQEIGTEKLKRGLFREQENTSSITFHTLIIMSQP